ncbi:MAG: hypothetical protein LBP21_05785 [Synergistaceae bacterium]|jgi:hypothetical protein|nr:hypothetical protein [Synergistaceae bacterium]
MADDVWTNIRKLGQQSGKAYLRYAGALSNESCAEIEAILQDTQRVDLNEWNPMAPSNLI